MPTSLVVALIAGGASIVTAVVSARVTSVLAARRAEKDARRAYEYEARRRLYEAYEPLRVGLLDCTNSAFARMVAIAAPPPESSSIDSSPQYRLRATVYFLLAPLVVARMVVRRLTLVDLGLDPKIHMECVLARAIFLSLSEDGYVARLEPTIMYTPYVDGWREKREECPQQYRRQGLPVGRLETALDALLVDPGDNTERLMSFGEFENALMALAPEDMHSGPGAARDLFLDFDPCTRPVLWRLLMIQALLYCCLQRAMFGEQIILDQPTVYEEFVSSQIYSELVAALNTSSTIPEPESIESCARIAAQYFSERIVPGMRRVGMLRTGLS